MSTLRERFEQRMRESVDPDRPSPAAWNWLLLAGSALMLVGAVSNLVQGDVLQALFQLVLGGPAAVLAVWQLRHGRRFMFASTERRLRQQLAEDERARREAGEAT